MHTTQHLPFSLFHFPHIYPQTRNASGAVIRNAPLQGRVHQVPVPTVLSLLRTLCEGYLSDTDTAKVPVEFLRASAFNVPIIVLAANDPSAPLPPHVLVGNSSSLCSNSVVGAVAFYDNTASACDLLSMVSLNQASGSSDGSGGSSDAFTSLPMGLARHIRGHLVRVHMACTTCSRIAFSFTS